MDLYEKLGVKRDATEDQIKKAYRKQAAKQHPDNPAGDHESFLGLAVARDTLLDPDARAIYDKTGQIPQDKPELPAAVLMIRYLAIELAQQSLNLVDAIKEALQKTATGSGRAATKHAAMIAEIEKHWKPDDIKVQVLAEFAMRKQQCENQKLVAEAALGLMKESKYEGVVTPDGWTRSSFSDMLRGR